MSENTDIKMEPENKNDYGIDECPDGDNCPVKIAMNSGLLPNDVKDNKNIRSHINEYHSHLDICFNESLYPFNILTSIINEKKKRIEIERQHKIKCFNCKNLYDNEDRKKFYLSCCCNTLCHQCIDELKSKECPFCKKSLNYLKDFKFEKKSKIKGEECFLCYSVLNRTQHTGKVKLDCTCKLELCITCAYKSLQDSHDNIRITELEDGTRVREKYTIKGKCSQCREIPRNKEEIIILYRFLPPVY